MSQHLAVIEWDSSMNPAVIVGPDAHSVNLLVIARVIATCAPEDIGDAPTFLLDHPAPNAADPNAAALAAAWLEALSEAATVPWVTHYVTAHREPGAPADAACEADVVSSKLARPPAPPPQRPASRPTY